MKRPAAAVAASSITKKSKMAKRSSPSASPPRRTNTKKCMALLCATIKKRKCMAIISKLNLGQLDGISKELLNLVDRIKVGLATKGARHLDPDTATILLGNALSEISNGLQNNIQELKTTLDNASQGKRDREEAAAAAAEDLGAKRQSFVDCKAALKRAAKEISVQQKAVDEAEMAEKASEVDARKVHDKKQSLAFAEHSAFNPLCEASACGLKGRKCLETLRRVGKTFGFHDELLSIAPVVMKKKLEARRTFDNDVLLHITREFNKNSKSLEIASQEAERGLEERKRAVHLASDRAAAAKMVQERCEVEHAALEQAVVDGRQALIEAQRQLRSFPGLLNQTTKRYERSERQLQRFRAGPLADYEKAFGAVPIPAARPCASEARKTLRDGNAAEEERLDEEEHVEDGSDA